MPGGFGLIARLFEGGLAGFDAMRGVGFSLCLWSATRASCCRSGSGRPTAARRRWLLLRASMERAHTIGARQMFLEVAVDNLPAQQLYLEHGFEQVGTRPDYYHRQNGQRMAAHTMRCDLRERWGNWPSLPAA